MPARPAQAGTGPERLPIRIDPVSRRVWVGDEERHLPFKQFDLLAYLMEHPGQAVDRRTILREVWEITWPSSTKTVDMHIAWLRRRIGDTDHTRIVTVRSVGYRWDDLGHAEVMPSPDVLRKQIAADIRAIARPYPADMFPADTNGGAIRRAVELAARIAEGTVPAGTTLSPPH